MEIEIKLVTKHLIHKFYKKEEKSRIYLLLHQLAFHGPYFVLQLKFAG